MQSDSSEPPNRSARPSCLSRPLALCDLFSLGALRTRPQLAINDAFEILADELQVLHAVTTATRASKITTQNFAKIQQDIIDDIKKHHKAPPPLAESLFKYPLDLNAKKALKFVEWAEATVRKMTLIGDTRWNSKFYAIGRAYNLRAAIQRFLSDYHPDLLPRFVEAMGSLLLFLCCSPFLLKILTSPSRNLGVRGNRSRHL